MRRREPGLPCLFVYPILTTSLCLHIGLRFTNIRSRRAHDAPIQPTHTMNLLNILESIEKLALEIILWLIFIPKTIFKVISEPDWVIDYVELEMKKPTGRYDNYISPILLFLVSSVVFFIINNIVDSSTGLAFQNYSNVTFESVSATLSGPAGILAALGFLTLPLLFSFGTELLNGQSFTRKRFQRIISIQCFYFSPLALSFYSVSLLAAFPLLKNIALGLLVVIFLWFCIAEIKLFGSELKYGSLRATALLTALIFTVFLANAAITNTTRKQLYVDANPAGYAETTSVRLPHNGRYAIITEGIEGTSGAYALVLNQVRTTGFFGLENDEEELSDVNDTLGVLIPDQPALGTVRSDMPGRWTFTGVAGDTLDLTAYPLERTLDPVINIVHDSSQSTVVVDEMLQGTAERTLFTVPVDGPYTISIQGYEGSSGDVFLVLRSKEESIINYGQTVTGTVQQERTTPWTFYAAEGDSLLIRAVPEDEALDAVISLYQVTANDTSMVQVADEFYSGLYEELGLTIPSSGTYRLEITGFEASEGGYKLSIEKPVPLEEAGLLASEYPPSSGTITFGQLSLSQIGEDEPSRWTFNGEPGDTLQIIAYPEASIKLLVDIQHSNGSSIFRKTNVARGRVEFDPEEIGRPTVLDDVVLPALDKYDVVVTSSGDQSSKFFLAVHKASEKPGNNTPLNHSGDIDYGSAVYTKVPQDTSSVWTFYGEEGDELRIAAKPVETDFNVILDVKDERGVSVVQPGFDWISGAAFVYIFFMGLTVFFWIIRPLLRKKPEEVEEADVAG